ncbi:MAG: DUF4431 domain-containing protein [Halanaerobiales bacterium]|nr:DUF4431 domain-containing protein [Halanaerobiales bacterium]
MVKKYLKSQCKVLFCMMFLVLCLVTTAFAEGGMGEQQYSYAGSNYELKGTLVQEMFYGPYNFGDTPEEDQKLYPYFLYLDNPIDVVSYEEDETCPNVYGITKLQIINGNGYDLSKYKNKKVNVYGNFIAGFSGHHFTDVLIDMNEIKEIKEHSKMVLSYGNRDVTVNNLLSEDVFIFLFGSKYVKRTRVHIGEGYYEEGTVVFENTKDEIFILWKNTEDAKNPAQIKITDPNSGWVLNDRITIGMPVKELVKINGRDFMFWGFGWDYGGQVESWNDGKIDSNVIIGLYAEKFNMPGTLGEVLLNSGDPRFKDVKFTVRSIMINFY